MGEQEVMADTLPLSWKQQVYLIVRKDFERECGITLHTKHGHFVDSCLSAIVHSYSDSIEYDSLLNPTLTALKGYRHTTAAISDCGRYLFTGTEDGCIIQTSIPFNSIVSKWQSDDNHQRIGLLAYHKGLLVCVTDYSNLICIWDAYNSHALIEEMDDHIAAVWCVDFINVKRESYLVSGSDDDTIRVWSMSNFECLRVFHGHTRAVRCLLIAPKSHSIDIISVSSKELCTWNMNQEHKPIRKSSAIFSRTPQRISSLSINCLGSMLCIVSHNQLTMVDYHSLNLLYHSVITGINQAVFSPSHPRMIVVGMQDGCLRTQIDDVVLFRYDGKKESHSFGSISQLIIPYNLDQYGKSDIILCVYNDMVKYWDLCDSLAWLDECILWCCLTGIDDFTRAMWFLLHSKLNTNTDEMIQSYDEVFGESDDNDEELLHILMVTQSHRLSMAMKTDMIELDIHFDEWNHRKQVHLPCEWDMSCLFTYIELYTGDDHFQLFDHNGEMLVMDEEDHSDGTSEVSTIGGLLLQPSKSDTQSNNHIITILCHRI